MGGKIWTKEEDKYISNNYGVMKSKDIAKAIGRTDKAVLVRAHKLGIKKSNTRLVITDSERDYYIDWDLCNKLLNTVRKAAGMELVPASSNPYV